VTIFGFLVRLDFHGVTSLIRWLALDPEHYETLLSFFRASSWELRKIQQCWVGVIQKYCPLLTLNEHLLLVGDGIKIAKEAKHMPGVKKLHQESDNSGKPPFIFGHHFGVVGLLAGTLKGIFCVPVMAEIHEGVEKLRAFQGKQPPMVDGKESVTIVTLMLSLASNLARSLTRPCVVILDAYFAVGPTFAIAGECLDEHGQRLLHVITKAKDNVVGYDPTRRNSQGRPPKWYHFWTSAIPKLSKKVAVDLNSVDKAKQRLIAKTMDAIEGFVNFGCIALRILQILAINYPQTIWGKYTGWLRTKRSDIPSEETVRSVIQETFYHNFHDFSDTAIYQIITAKQRQHLYLYDKDAA